MADLGTVAQRVNANKMKVYIGSTANQYKLIQNARMLISHPVYREPTTDGGVVLYTGAPDHSLSGTLLYTRDEWDDGTSNDLKSLVAISNGEVAANTWLVEMTDVSGTATGSTFTFTNGKVSVVDINKSVEGAVKIDFTVVLPDEPTAA